MKILDWVRASTIALSVLVIIGGLALLYSWDTFFGDATVGALKPTDFENLERPEGKGFLVCPRFICLASEPDREPSVFDVPAERLRALVLEYIDSQPEIRIWKAIPADQQYEFIEKTPEMRSPDIISVKFFPLSDNSSTMAIYSRSPLEDNDSERSRLRIEKWLRLIDPQ